MTQKEFIEKYGTKGWFLVLQKYADNANVLPKEGKEYMDELLKDLKSVFQNQKEV